MDLSKISTVVRPRSNWQAIDLGFRMARQWYMPLITGYLLLTLPIFIILHLTLKSVEPYLPMLILWWLKPLWEKILLAYISVRQFGETPSLKTLLNMWRKVALRHLLPALTWRRLSVQRSYISAITQLENLKGGRRQKRATQFAGENQQAAFWLTIVGAHVEAFITWAVFILAIIIMPQQMQSFDLLGTLAENGLFVDIAYYIAIVSFAPFYVCAGFSLYLNQRTKVEGWDIEITFRRLVARRQNRLKTTALSSSLSTALIGIMLATALVLPQPTLAAQETKEQIAIRQAAEQIVNQPPFVNIDEKTYPEYYLNQKAYSDEEDDKTESDENSGAFLQSLIKFFASGVEWVLYAVLAILLVFLMLRYRHVLMELLQTRQIKDEQDAPKVVFGLNIDKASLPDDPAKAAQALWQQGQKRQALSLLYRGALMLMVSRGKLHVHDSYTEGECLEQVRTKGATQLADYFGDITKAWQQLAYARIEPEEATMQALFSRWHSVFLESLNDK